MAPAASTAREASALGGAHFTPAEVETWGDEGGGLEAPATRPSWLSQKRAEFRASVWAPVATKLLGLSLAMIALSGVGIASILTGAGGVPIPLASMLGSDVHSAWLASKPVPSARVSRTASAAVTSDNTPAPASNVSPPTPNDATASGGAPATGAQSPGMTSDGKVILNLAGADDLRHLPGVGKKRADAILLLRTRLGHFKHVNDLLRVKGIGVRGLKKILAHVVLDAV